MVTVSMILDIPVGTMAPLPKAGAQKMLALSQSSGFGVRSSKRPPRLAAGTMGPCPCSGDPAVRLFLTVFGYQVRWVDGQELFFHP